MKTEILHLNLISWFLNCMLSQYGNYLGYNTSRVAIQVVVRLLVYSEEKKTNNFL